MTPAEARQRAVEAAAKAIHTQFVAQKPTPDDWPSWGELLAQGHQGMHRVNDTREQAAAALAAYEAALWQPIDTAPRDGTRVLVFAPPSGSEYPAMVQRVDWWRDGGWWQMRPGHPYTHWRPLPTPPEEASDAP